MKPRAPKEVKAGRRRKPLAIVRDLEGAPIVRGHRARFEALLAELRRSLRTVDGCPHADPKKTSRVYYCGLCAAERRFRWRRNNVTRYHHFGDDKIDHATVHWSQHRRGYVSNICTAASFKTLKEAKTATEAATEAELRRSLRAGKGRA